MDKKLFFVILMIICVSIGVSAIPADTTYQSSVIQKICITESDMPDGFMYGQIPGFAKSVLRNNPWEMDRTAINKLTKQLYPDGDAGSVKNMHLSIIARREKPFNDDIVCYIILFNDRQAAKKEIEKLNGYNRMNSDRTILTIHGNLAVFLIVDDVDNYKYIDLMQKKIEERINSL